MICWFKDGKFQGEIELKNIIDGKKIVLFGASKRNEHIYKKLDKSYVTCIFDNDGKKWNTCQEGIPVVRPCGGIGGAVLLSVLYEWKDICSQIETLGYKEIYFFISEEEEKRLKKYISVFAPTANDNVIFEDAAFRYVHVMPDEKFFMPVVEFIEYGLNMKEHFFLIYGMNGANSNDDYGIWHKYKKLLEKYHNIYLFHDGSKILNLYNWDENRSKMDKLLDDSEKIIFHGEWFTDTIFQYFCTKVDLVRKKGIFLPWAGRAGRNPRTNRFIEGVLQYSKMIVCSNGLIVENLKQAFPNLVHAIWLNNRFSYARLTKNIFERHKGTRNIFVAHCAHDYANPIESLKYMQEFDDSCHIYCITSYGARKEEVEKYGRENFGKRFTSIGSYMSYDEYVNFLSKMDIAILGMENMAGRDTLELLFWLGVKVYLKPESEVYRSVVATGYKVNNYYFAKDEDIELLFENREREYNHLAAADEFDIETKLYQWKELYEYDLER